MSSHHRKRKTIIAAAAHENGVDGDDEEEVRRSAKGARSGNPPTMMTTAGEAPAAGQMAWSTFEAAAAPALFVDDAAVVYPDTALRGELGREDREEDREQEIQKQEGEQFVAGSMKTEAWIQDSRELLRKMESIRDEGNAFLENMKEAFNNRIDALSADVGNWGETLDQTLTSKDEGREQRGGSVCSPLIALGLRLYHLRLVVLSSVSLRSREFMCLHECLHVCLRGSVQSCVDVSSPNKRSTTIDVTRACCCRS